MGGRGVKGDVPKWRCGCRVLLNVDSGDIIRMFLCLLLLVSGRTDIVEALLDAGMNPNCLDAASSECSAWQSNIYGGLYLEEKRWEGRAVCRNFAKGRRTCGI